MNMTNISLYSTGFLVTATIIYLELIIGEKATLYSIFFGVSFRFVAKYVVVIGW